MLTLQSGQLMFTAIANFILGAYTGVVMNLVAFVRNAICLKVKYTIALKLIFSAILVGLGLYANNRGFLGILPIIGTVLVTCCLDVENVLKLKVYYVIGQCLWIFYDFAVKNYVCTATDAFGIVSNMIGIISVRKLQKD